MGAQVSARLFLLPTCLGDTDPASVLPARYLPTIEHLRAFFVEDLRSARRFLRKIGYRAAFEDVLFVDLNEHTRASSLDEVLRACALDEGALLTQDWGVLSEAGLPCVADPGALAVEWAHRHGMQVVPLCGPSSIFLALMASGLNGQNFCFHGYLPVEDSARTACLHNLEAAARRNAESSRGKAGNAGLAPARQTQIFIETPYRNDAVFDAVLKICRPDTRLCVACQITCEDEFIRTLTVADWRAACKAGHRPDIHKKNVVFLIG